jgi:very-short-patch-repair endonuclease
MSKRRHSALPSAVVNARNLRKQSTPSEAKLWEALRNRRLKGYKFRRQYPVGRWIVDFYCLERSLGIEVDGSMHDLHMVRERDQAREELLRQFGIQIIRVTADQIERDLTSVLRVIAGELLSPADGTHRE